MKITFIVPAYNVEETIGRTIDSILHQTDGRYQIIIVNDGSTDQTETICKSYCEKYPNKITYVSQSNKGLGGARNRGLELVTTEYVAFIDSDDWLVPQYVENVLRQLEQKEVEMIMTLPVIFHEGSNTVRDWYDKTLFEEVFVEDGVIINPQKENRIYQFEVNQCRKILNMDFVREIKFKFREQIKWEDVFPHFYLLSKCEKCMGIGSVGFYYRTGNSQQITNMRGKERFDVLIVFDDLLNYILRESRNDLEFPVMRVMVRFAIWCIRMSNLENRKLMVAKLHEFFTNVPGSFYKSLMNGCKEEYSRADALQYWFFLLAIRSKMLTLFFTDYLYQDIGEKVIKKLLRAKQRVA